jgi:transcriptional regulator with XRE-family HTH domain
MAGSYLNLRDLLRGLGARAQQLRLLRDVSQEALATRAGVSVKTLRRFESTGQATVESALRIAVALHAVEGFEALFAAPPFKTLAEAEAREATKSRRRASRRRVRRRA